MLSFELNMFLVGMVCALMGWFVLPGGEVLFNCGIVICLFANAIFMYKSTEHEELKDKAD